MSGRLTTTERQTLQRALQKAESEVNRGWGGAYGVVFSSVEAILRAHPCDHEAQIRDLLEEREELLTVIRRLRMGNHPAGRALRINPEAAMEVWHEGNVVALRAALTERDAEHEGGVS